MHPLLIDDTPHAADHSTQLQQQLNVLEQSIASITSQHNINKDTSNNQLLLTNVVEPVSTTLAKTSASQITETIPLYSLIPSETKAKIKKGDFVDFYALLHPTEGKMFGIGIKSKETELGFMTSLSEVQPKSKPLSIMAWCRAFA